MLMSTNPGDLVLDPTCGSGTTAFVAEKWGRRWITCDTSRVAITLAKQRLMTASFDYYALRYPNEGLGGGFDYLLQVVTPDIDAYQRLIDAILGADVGLARYFTYIVTNPVKSAPPPLDLLAARQKG